MGILQHFYSNSYIFLPNSRRQKSGNDLATMIVRQSPMKYTWALSGGVFQNTLTHLECPFVWPSLASNQ